MTKEKAESIVNNSIRCTQATLRAFGVEGIRQLNLCAACRKIARRLIVEKAEREAKEDTK